MPPAVEDAEDNDDERQAAPSLSCVCWPSGHLAFSSTSFLVSDL